MTDDYTKLRELLLNNPTSKIAGKSAIPHLITALKDENKWVRGRAAEKLGKIAERHPDYNWKEAVPALIDALKDESSNVRWMAAGALGKIKDASAIPVLIDALKDEDADVRWYATWALGCIAERHPDCNRKEAVPALIDALKDKDRLVRSYAAEALGKIKDVSAVPALIDALKDKDWLVRSYAAEALGKFAEKTEIGLRAAAKALKEYVDSVKKKGNATEIRNAKKEAISLYKKICKAARKRSAESHSLSGDGLILEGTVKPPSDKKMCRKGTRRAFA